ncbi:acetolactate synthase small subunit [Paenibacillus sp. HJGM_3]|uniref:acetolactate synthase small subunit n=1 Tax=Paenibacillus sp. HJGM_3 TaxID=3379816 RepID=UPI003859F548
MSTPYRTTPTQTLSVLVQDRPGVLQRVAGLFSRRGYNMDSLSVGACEEEGLTRMTIVLSCETAAVTQVAQQLRKLMDVLDVRHLSRQPMVVRELLLIKLQAPPESRPELLSLVETFRCSVIDVGQASIVIQVVGDVDKNNALLRLLEPYELLELTRTGATAMSRGT